MISNKLQKSMVYAILSLSVTMVACGPPADTLAKKSPPPAEKPYNPTSDEGSSAQALWLMADFSFLSEALFSLGTLGKTSAPCRTFRALNQKMDNESSAAQFDFEVASNCVVRVGSSTAQFQGRERFALKNLQRLVDPGSGFGSVAFQEATVMLLEPHKITLIDPSMKGLSVTHALRLTRDTRTLYTYKFELESRWTTDARDLKTYPYVGDWVTHIEGLVRLIGGIENTELYNLVISQRSDLQLRKGGSGDNKSLTDSQSLGLALSSHSAQLSKSGMPVADWQGVYSTSMNPGEQKEIDFRTTAQMLVNKTLNKNYQISDGVHQNLEFISLGVRAAQLHYQSR